MFHNQLQILDSFDMSHENNSRKFNKNRRPAIKYSLEREQVELYEKNMKLHGF